MSTLTNGNPTNGTNGKNGTSVIKGSPIETNGSNGTNGTNLTNGSNVLKQQQGVPKTDPVLTYDTVLGIAELIRPENFVAEVGIICGTGLGLLGDRIEIIKRVPFEDIPNFHKPTVEGHAGEVIFGYLGGMNVVCLKGRFHYYEGYSIEQCSMPVRIMKLLGIKVLIVTNAAGGIGKDYRVGDLVIMKDHINFMGMAGICPLIGPNDTRFGPRFPPMKFPYCPRLRKLGRFVAKELGILHAVHEGTYVCLGGPNYESGAEIRFLKAVGVDTIGMSTVHEVITANHCGIRVFGFSLVTNICTEDDNQDDDDGLDHGQVSEVGNKNSHVLSQYVENFCKKLRSELDQM